MNHIPYLYWFYLGEFIQGQISKADRIHIPELIEQLYSQKLFEEYLKERV